MKKKPTSHREPTLGERIELKMRENQGIPKPIPRAWWLRSFGRGVSKVAYFAFVFSVGYYAHAVGLPFFKTQLQLMICICILLFVGFVAESGAAILTGRAMRRVIDKKQDVADSAAAAIAVIEAAEAERKANPVHLVGPYEQPLDIPQQPDRYKEYGADEK